MSAEAPRTLGSVQRIINSFTERGRAENLLAQQADEVLKTKKAKRDLLEALKPHADRMKSATLNEPLDFSSNVSFVRTKDGFVVTRIVRDILPVPSYHYSISTGYPIYSCPDSQYITLVRKECVAFSPDFGVFSVMRGERAISYDEQLVNPERVTNPQQIIEVLNNLAYELKRITLKELPGDTSKNENL